MHNSQTELETAIEVLRNLPGSRLQSAEIGLLEHEMQYGLGDLAHDGLDGEVRLSFEDCPPVYISWAGTPSQDRDGGNCTQIRESTFHRNIPYVVAPEACVLSHAVGQRLTKCRVFGYASDPLVWTSHGPVDTAIVTYGPPMKPRISMITLGVQDLDAAVRFYEEGLRFPRMASPPEVAFFTLNGSWLGLYGRDALAEDAGVSPAGSGFSGFALAHNVESEQEVDRVIAQAVTAGATLVKQPQKAFWGGYTGYFADPDGHLWEIAHNPLFWVGPSDGND